MDTKTEEDIAYEKHLASVAENFIEAFEENYVHRSRTGYATHYKHEDFAEAFRADWLGNFYVTFSIPKNKTSVVCSFWALEEHEDGTQSKRKIQLDLVPMVGHLIENFYNYKYLPMPKHDSSTTSEDEDF